MRAWTDYPIAELGDAPYVEAPVRECEILSYDGNKYCKILVAGVRVEVKAGYLYSKPGRLGKTPKVRVRTLESPP